MFQEYPENSFDETGESNDGLRRHFLLLNNYFQATAVVPTSRPAAKTIIPTLAPAVVARMGAIPSKRNPNTNLASLPSMIFSLMLNSFNADGRYGYPLFRQRIFHHNSYGFYLVSDDHWI